MNQCEIKIGNIFNSKRAALAARFATAFNQAEGDVEEALAKAFEFAASKLLAKESFDVNDFERLVCWKMRRLLLDAIAASQRTHYRKSVKAVAFLDAESDVGDDYRVSMITKASLARFQDKADRLEVDSIQESKAIKMVLKNHGRNDRDADIADKIIFCSANRKALATAKGLSLSAINRIYGICVNILLENTQEVRLRYAELKEKMAA